MNQNLARLGTYVEESNKDVCHNILQVVNLTIDNTNDVNMEEVFEEISYIITPTNWNPETNCYQFGKRKHGELQENMELISNRPDTAPLVLFVETGINSTNLTSGKEAHI